MRHRIRKFSRRRVMHACLSANAVHMLRHSMCTAFTAQAWHRRPHLLSSSSIGMQNMGIRGEDIQAATGPCSLDTQEVGHPPPCKPHPAHLGMTNES